MMRSIKLVLDDKEFLISFAGSKLFSVSDGLGRKGHLLMAVTKHDLDEIGENSSVLLAKLHAGSIKIQGDPNCVYLLPAAIEAISENIYRPI